MEGALQLSARWCALRHRTRSSNTAAASPPTASVSVKTYTALAVIKYFEPRNEKVLVLCPKKRRRNWSIYEQPSALNPFRRDHFGFHELHHTDLSRVRGEVDGLDLATPSWAAYDLVVIDESHNFRNNKLAAQRPGDRGRRPA